VVGKIPVELAAHRQSSPGLAWLMNTVFQHGAIKCQRIHLV